MAPAESTSSTRNLSTKSYQTALCIIPPPELRVEIDELRALYDKSYGKWPAHINLIYPFVAPDDLPQAIKLIASRLESLRSNGASSELKLRVDRTDYFTNRQSDTVFAAPNESSTESLSLLRRNALHALKQQLGDYKPHMTLGQSEINARSIREHLLQKGLLCLPIDWEVQELMVLIREKTDTVNQMHPWASIKLSDLSVKKFDGPTIRIPTNEYTSNKEKETALGRGQSSASGSIVELKEAYQFNNNNNHWEPCLELDASLHPEIESQTFKVASYNVMLGSDILIAEQRFHLILHSLLSDTASSDVLCLQEVSDEFLSFLLSDDAIRYRYPFTTHGPPSQNGIGPLPNVRNIVILSRHRFRWCLLKSKQRHKEAVVVELGLGNSWKYADLCSPIIVGVHLTAGLNDSAILAKKSQLETVLHYLTEEYPQNPWIIAGDFNITTSASSISKALKRGLLSSSSVEILSDLESLLSHEQMADAWLTAAETQGPGSWVSEGLQEGEEGATFDPIMNSLAASTTITSRNRPQRYDRIIMKASDSWTAKSFSMFGFQDDSVFSSDENSGTITASGSNTFGSDHWGIACSFLIQQHPKQDTSVTQVTAISAKRAPQSINDSETLTNYLTGCGMIPSHADREKWDSAFELLKAMMLQTTEGDDGALAVEARTIVVPVGSYGLGVWSNSSDIDCLCIGSISSKTFFALAAQRLAKAAHLGIRILRKVDAKSGTMLELSVNDVRMDLQYCPASKLTENWNSMTELPISDPAFNLPMNALIKLKSLRDQNYMIQTTPNTDSFRTAHRLIRLWATHRGIYSAKYGYLGGYHLALLLSRVCKMLVEESTQLSTADVISTFFDHYADFDFKTQLIYDPFFYASKPNYRRSAKEPLVLLGLHVPRTNVAHTASIPSLRTIAEELKRANDMIDEGASWAELVGTAPPSVTTTLPSGVQEFLSSYKSYLKINVQYWGASLEKGSMLVGWLESRCIALLVEINRRLPEIHSRIWPARFSAVGPDDQDEYRGCYLIGLARTKHEEKVMSAEDRKISQGKFDAVLERFATQLRNDDRYFDSATSWVDIEHIKQSELGSLQLDRREWGDYVVPDELGLQEDEKQESDDNEAPQNPLPQRHKGVPSTSKSAGGRGRLRPAGDVLSRLRWDPSLDSTDYVVGYEDRFVGAREADLDKWKTEQTDEEFIPQHRILYFKQKSTGDLIWERASRTDQLFGSGSDRK